MTALRKISTLFCLAAAALASSGLARADDPVLKPGLDPGGMAVAILADGFDYTNPALAKILARDGEGEAIAWDTVDEDHRPYRKDGQGTAAALTTAASGNVRIVQVRIDPKDTASLARGIAFAAQTPAKIVLAVLPASDAPSRDVVIAAARKFETILFIGSAPALTPDDKAPSDGIANLILAEAGEHGHAAAEALAAIWECASGPPEGLGAAELKRAILDRRKETATAECHPKGAGKPD
ncbi:MAG TPA: hypothetical protein PK857_09850 [Hyphomicrobium sp.]|nr:hypothetical protein [Hyphomicrobium sp.]HRO51039.1 hypothetical protein [Hyphomicrobium sp.]